jgi:hypothetical protein
MIEDDREIDGARDALLEEERVDGVREQQKPPGLRMEEWIRSEPVTGSQQGAMLAVTDHRRARAKDPFDRALAPRLVRMQNEARVVLL